MALKANHRVKIFLLNKGVEAENIISSKFDVKEQMDSFTRARRRKRAGGDARARVLCSVIYIIVEILIFVLCKLVASA